jgi:hypothetical protein
MTKIKLRFISARNILTTFKRPKQNFIIDLNILEIEPKAFQTRIKRSTAKLQPLILRLS